MSQLVDEVNDGNLRKTCRLCLEEPHPNQMLDMNLIYDEEAQLSYYDCYEVCAKENLLQCSEFEPNSLCKHCGIELQWAYSFYKKLQLSRQKINNMKIIMDADIESDDQSDVENKPVVELEKIEPSLPSSSVELTEFSHTKKEKAGKYDCQFCKRVCCNKSQLKKHLQIHKQNRQKFNCQSCSASYFNKRTLNAHMKKKHKISGGNACTICKKEFCDANALKMHMICHNDIRQFECNQCNRKAYTRRELEDHQRVWHRSSSIFCEFPRCSKSFKTLSELHEHESTHTEIPFECTVCQQGFTARYKLQAHTQREHNMVLTAEQMQNIYLKRSNRILAKKEHDNNGATN